MSDEQVSAPEPESVLIAIPLGRDSWASRQATLHYAGSRLVKAEGVDFPRQGPNGPTGTLYLVRANIQRDHRRLLRVERQQLVDGQIISTQNWGEVEDNGSVAA